jgi:hypothetical protein
MAVAPLAGLTRGFSGFGGAMIFMPLLAAIYDPRIAASPSCWSISCRPRRSPSRSPPLHLARGAPLSIAMAVGLPIGTGLAGARPDRAALVHRRVVLSVCRCWRRAGAITASRGCRSPSASDCSPASARRGADRGPPVILYWLGGGSSAETCAPI